MVGVLRPRNETEFIHELKAWFIKTQKGQCYFERVSGMSGHPDVKFGMIGPKGVPVAFEMEAKWMNHKPRTLASVWNLLRKNQQLTMTKLAAFGRTIYLTVCINGREAWWYKFHPDMCARSLAGKVKPWEVIYLSKVGRRDFLGRWELGESADEN